MAAKTKSIYICSSCGSQSPKWYGKCPSCGEWNTLSEEPVQVPSAPDTAAKRLGRAATAMKLSDISGASEARYSTGLAELDRVLGGGIVKGSVMLMSGDPGIGKSTLLLQICNFLGQNMRVLYVSGEESMRQIKLRAMRLKVDSDNLMIMSETDVESICEFMRADKPDIAIIDSIQTMNFAELNSSPGSVAQVRECTNLILRTCKSLEIPVFIVGHVNKDGNIAGPKVMEHIVDGVLYFEGERTMSYRMLRAIKNRYGATNEIGVFEMGDCGLTEVENPSMMLLSGRVLNASGTCVASVMEGTRPVMAEVQALVSSGYGNPRRMSTGFDYNRLCLLLAVLEKRAGFYYGNSDVYVNVVGGLRLDEPAADLPIALSLMSSLKDKTIGDDVVAFGEVGLTGEIRTVPNAGQRINEAMRLGFRRVIVPKHNLKALSPKLASGIEIIGVRNIREAFSAI